METKLRNKKEVLVLVPEWMTGLNLVLIILSFELAAVHKI